MPKLDLPAVRELGALLAVATGPDRKLDAAVEVAFVPEAARAFGNSGVVISHDFGRGAADYPAPRYTKSFDATLALAKRLLPGWKWSAGYGCGEDGDDRRTVNLWDEKHWVQGEHDVDVIAFLLALIAAVNVQADGGE